MGFWFAKCARNITVLGFFFGGILHISENDISEYKGMSFVMKHILLHLFTICVFLFYRTIQWT